MNPLFLPSLAFWVFVITALGWLYSILAVCWPRLFHREIIRHAHKEALGYRLGRAIYWQLPLRTAFLIAILSTIPWLALALLPERIVCIVLSVSMVILILLWLTHSPGQRLGIMDVSGGDHGTAFQGMMFELRTSGGILRSIAVYIVFGVIPAIVIGIGLDKVWTLWGR